MARWGVFRDWGAFSFDPPVSPMVVERCVLRRKAHGCKWRRRYDTSAPIGEATYTNKTEALRAMALLVLSDKGKP